MSHAADVIFYQRLYKLSQKSEIVIFYWIKTRRVKSFICILYACQTLDLFTPQTSHIIVQILSLEWSCSRSWIYFESLRRWTFNNTLTLKLVHKHGGTTSSGAPGNCDTELPAELRQQYLYLVKQARRVERRVRRGRETRNWVQAKSETIYLQIQQSALNRLGVISAWCARHRL